MPASLINQRTGILYLLVKYLNLFYTSFVIFKSINIKIIMKSILKLSFIASLIFCTQLAFGQTEMTAEMSSEKETKEMKEVPQIFKDYAWLKEKVNPEDCQGAVISVRSNPANPATKLVQVKSKDESVFYDTTGKYYCKNHSKLNCLEFYKLDEELDSWTCK